MLTSAWPHQGGEGFNIEPNALPVNGRIILMRPKVEQGVDEAALAAMASK